MKRRFLTLTLLLGAIVAIPVTAQRASHRLAFGGPGPEGPGAFGPGPATLLGPARCCPVLPPRRVLTRVLELDEAQLDQVAQLAEEIAAAVGPLREQARVLGGELKTELESEEPDACEVGRLVLALKQIHQEICATEQSFADDFAAILNEDQLAKWETIKERFCSQSGPRRGPRPGDKEGPGDF